MTMDTGENTFKWCNCSCDPAYDHWLARAERARQALDLAHQTNSRNKARLRQARAEANKLLRDQARGKSGSESDVRQALSNLTNAQVNTVRGEERLQFASIRLVQIMNDLPATPPDESDK